jgi:hypothetical protein
LPDFSDLEPTVLGLTGCADRIEQGTLDMVVARTGEEMVCPRGTLCGRMVRDANNQISDGDFILLENASAPDGEHYTCACCGRTVAARDDPRWRVHLRRGWVQ